MAQTWTIAVLCYKCNTGRMGREKKNPLFPTDRNINLTNSTVPVGFLLFSKSSWFCSRLCSSENSSLFCALICCPFTCFSSNCLLSKKNSVPTMYSEYSVYSTVQSAGGVYTDTDYRLYLILATPMDLQKSRNTYTHVH